jgi:hypothetical protein
MINFENLIPHLHCSRSGSHFVHMLGLLHTEQENARVELGRGGKGPCTKTKKKKKTRIPAAGY